MEMQIEDLQIHNQKLREENELKSGLLSLISHDQKEVFASLIWLIESMEQGSIGTDDFFKMLPRIKSDAKKNLQTLEDTGALLRTQTTSFTLQISELNSWDVFQQLQQEFQKQLTAKNINFQFIGDDHLQFDGDSLLISFILKKLLDNAIKYSHPAQTISFSARKEENSVVLSLRDEGIGMDAAHLETLFDFQSPVFKGTQGEIGAGLSLKIVKNFVHLMRGRLEVFSEENSGVEISVFLPQK